MSETLFRGKRPMKGIKLCAECADYDMKKHRCRRWATDDETDPRAPFYADCPLADVEPVRAWISVKDRLPPPNTPVLVYRPGMAVEILVDVYEVYFSEGERQEGWVRYGRNLYMAEVITHWMPLPEPPKEEA